MTKRKTPQQMADKLAGDIVRARGACENCGATNVILQWAHGFSRSYQRVRHDLRNGFCLCIACHFKFTHQPIEWDDWLMNRWGPDLYRELRMEAINYNGPPVDLKATVARLRVEWERVAA